MLASATPFSIHEVRAENTSSIQWKPCILPGDDAVSAQFECGSYDVPLDYTDDASEETLKIDIVRALATKPSSERKGSIFFNFGGPGYDGVADLVAYSDLLLGYVKPLNHSHELVMAN